MLGSPSTRDQLETDALMPNNATDREPAQVLDGVKVPPDPPRAQATTTTRLSLETNAPPPHLMPTTPTETTTVTEPEPAQLLAGVKEPLDDHHPYKH